MLDPVVFGPELERPSAEELLTAEFDSAVAVLRPYVDAAMRATAVLVASLQPMADSVNQMVRALAPVIEVRAKQMSAQKREYHRRSLARKRRRH